MCVWGNELGSNLWDFECERDPYGFPPSLTHGALEPNSAPESIIPELLAVSPAFLFFLVNSVEGCFAPDVFSRVVFVPFHCRNRLDKRLKGVPTRTCTLGRSCRASGVAVARSWRCPRPVAVAIRVNRNIADRGGVC